MQFQSVTSKTGFVSRLASIAKHLHIRYLKILDKSALIFYDYNWMRSQAGLKFINEEFAENVSHPFRSLG